jgi:hypothetical protein
VVAPTPENYGLYTDSDLRIYADALDARIQEALNISFGNPALYLGAFKFFANCLRDIYVLMRMTDKNVVGHR